MKLRGRWPPGTLHSLLVFLSSRTQRNTTDAMNTTGPSIELVERLKTASGALFPVDHYSLLGVDFSLRTDSREVRDFFRAAYRHFARTTGEVTSEIGFVAVIGAQAGGPWVAAGDSLVELSGRGMPVNRAFLFLL